MKKDEVLRKSIVAAGTVALVFAAITVFSSTGSIVEVLQGADLLLLLAAFLVANLNLFVTSFIWKTVFSEIEVDLSLRESFGLVLSNTFVNNVTPFGHIGGEPAVIYLVKRKTAEPSGKVLSGIAVADTLTFLPLLTSGLIGAALHQEYISAMILPLAALKKKALGFTSELRKGLQNLWNNRRKMLAPLTLSHLTIITEILAVYIITAALSIPITLAPLLLVMPLARTGNYLPTPGGAGTYETALIGLLIAFYSLSLPEAGAVAILYRTITFIPGLVFGYTAFVKMN